MPWLFFIAAFIFPRGLIAFVWLTSTWFEGVFETTLWPVLGFLFAPLTMLWYSTVVRVYGGQWDTLQIVVLVVAILMDLSSASRKKKKKSKND